MGASASVPSPLPSTEEEALALGFSQAQIEEYKTSQVLPPPFWPTSGDQAERDEISEIIPNLLYLTNHRGAEKREELLALGVRQVLNVNGGADENAFPSEFEYLNIDNVTDDVEMAPRLLKHFDASNTFLAAAPTCVHCAAGISRSSTLVLAFLLSIQFKEAESAKLQGDKEWCGPRQVEEAVSLRRAFVEVRRSRKVAWPNNGFFATLIDYEAKLRGKLLALGGVEGGGLSSYQGGCPSITLEEWEKWGDFDAEAYAAARKVDRPVSDGAKVADESPPPPTT